MKTAQTTFLVLLLSAGLIFTAQADPRGGGGGRGGSHASFSAASGGGAGIRARGAGPRYAAYGSRFANSHAVASIVARHSANWQPNWSRNSDHWWHGHRCRWVNGSWVVFDLGFYPWYYPYGYYPWGYYGYDPGVYEGAYYGDQGYYNGPGQGAGSVVAAAQQQLAQEGYYQGEIDGISGPMTRRAILRFQRAQGLRATGTLTKSTLDSLGLG